MNRKYLFLLIGLLNTIFFSCEKEMKHTVEIPMSGINLKSPEEKSIYDLNDFNVERLCFAWNKVDSIKSYSLLLSLDQYLIDPYIIQVGDAGAITFDVRTFDSYISELGIKDGEKIRIFWSVKSTDNLTAAANDIWDMTVRRLRSRLLVPQSQELLILDAEEPETEYLFKWDNEGLPTSNSYNVVFSKDMNFKGTIVKFPSQEQDELLLTHNNLQELIDKLQLKKYDTNAIYWNVENSSDGKHVSLSSRVLNLEGMRLFTDVRGNESITYRVSKIKYVDGTVAFWLADNLRTKKYPDGTDIEPANIKETPPGRPGLPEDYIEVFGASYRASIKNKLAPTGWHLPTKAEFEGLFRAAGAVPGRYNVLKDPDYYPEHNKTEGHLNEWKFNLVASGHWLWWWSYQQENKHCYLLVSDSDPDRIAMHDGGGTIWYAADSGGGGIRFVYNGD